MKPRLLPILLALLLALALAAPSFADTFAIDFYTLDCGGGEATGGQFSISPGAIGQPATARITGLDSIGFVYIYGGLIGPDTPRNGTSLTWSLYQ